MSKLVQVRLGEYGLVGFYDAGDVGCKCSDVVIIQVERGLEYGRIFSRIKEDVALPNQTVEGKVLRVAAKEDLAQIEANKQKAKDAVSECLKKIAEHKLEMQIIKAEYTFDATKIIFVFSAEGRVDFRALVRDLARIFKVRIELRQIGVRDKAKIIGGLGICGRVQCCACYMKGFFPLSIKMAKEQNLPLNPSKIAGSCDKVKCCMAYELSVYREYAKDMPRAGEKIVTPDGKGHVIDVNILKRCATVDMGDGKIVKMFYPRSEK